MGAVFISYRREDAAGEARALFNHLVATLGKNSVFMDVDNIALGRDFRQILQENLATCDLMLALIGKGWVDAKNQSGRRRLEDPDDFIRLEIASALKRNIPVTPVLLQGAHMPAAEQLPEDLRDFTYRNGFELSHNRWESDVQEMIKRLGLGKQPGKEAPTMIGVHVAEPGEKTHSEKLKFMATLVRSRWAWMAVMAVLGGGLLFNINHTKTNEPASTISTNGQPTVGSPGPPTETSHTPVRLPADGLSPNDSIATAKSITEGTTVRGSRVKDQDLYFFQFLASSTKTRLVLRKRSARGFRAVVDVYDHVEHRIAGEAEGVALVGAQDQPVSFSFESTPGKIYYIKVTVQSQADAEYELTVREE
jgi:hypothetical protein